MTSQNLRIFWEELRFWQVLSASAKSGEGREAAERHVRGWKERIREANRESSGSRIVKDNGIDGYIELVFIPLETATDKETVEDFFRAYRCIEPRYSAYDCTGCAFTNWFKVFKRRGFWYAYHSVSYDV